MSNDINNINNINTYVNNMNNNNNNKEEIEKKREEIEIEVEGLGKRGEGGGRGGEEREKEREEERLTVVEQREDKYFGSGGGLEGYHEGRGGEEEDNVIRLNNVHKTYLLGVEGVPALRGISLSIRRGEFICIYGTSGGGKTSLLNILGTIDKPTKGELFINLTRYPSTPLYYYLF